MSGVKVQVFTKPFDCLGRSPEIGLRKSEVAGMLDDETIMRV
jgi:hypothetical protein